MISKSRYNNNDMLTSSSGGKPLLSRRHIDENARLEAGPEVPHEATG